MLYDAKEDTTTAIGCEIRLISLGDSTLGDVIQSIQTEYNPRLHTGEIGIPYTARLSRPTDFNGDGFHDIILSTQDRIGDDPHDMYQTLDIHFGGLDLDEVPDWRITRFNPDRTVVAFRVASGYDVNGDGYDDMLVWSQKRIDNDPDNWKKTYEIFLGGEEMDTIPAWEMHYDHFEGRVMATTNGNGWAMLPDLNGDGFDDWGLCYWQSIPQDDGPNISTDGVYVFFGGDELDQEPDVELLSFPRDVMNHGELIGGDFNEDGYGDVVRGAPSFPPTRLIRFYFGRERWEEEPDPDLVYRGRIGEGGYASANYGSVGDYNGDGADDYVVSGLYIISGWDNGNAVSDPDPLPFSPKLESSIYPNPFNDMLTISVKADRNKKIEIDIYDIAGKLVEKLGSGNKSLRNQSYTWKAELSGIYFVVAKSGGQSVVKKVVCLK